MSPSDVGSQLESLHSEAGAHGGAAAAMAQLRPRSLSAGGPRLASLTIPTEHDATGLSPKSIHASPKYVGNN